MEQVKAIFSYIIALVLSPQKHWETLTDDSRDEANPERVQWYYYMPLMAVCAVLVFLFTGLRSPSFNLEVALKSSTAFLMAFLTGPYIAEFILRGVLPRFFAVQPPKNRMMVFIFYTMSLFMLASLVSHLIPKLRFFDLLVLYPVFVVWCASSVYLGIKPSRQLAFTLSTSGILFLSYWLVSYVLGLVGR